MDKLLSKPQACNVMLHERYGKPCLFARSLAKRVLMNLESFSNANDDVEFVIRRGLK